jgi:hypothetical protein
MEPEEGSIDMHPTNPKGCFRGEWDPTTLDLATLLLRMAHVLSELFV